MLAKNKNCGEKIGVAFLIRMLLGVIWNVSEGDAKRIKKISICSLTSSRLRTLGQFTLCDILVVPIGLIETECSVGWVDLYPHWRPFGAFHRNDIQVFDTVVSWLPIPSVNSQVSMHKNYFLVKAFHHWEKVLEEILVDLDVWIRMCKHNHSIVGSTIVWSSSFDPEKIRSMSSIPFCLVMDNASHQINPNEQNLSL